MKIKYQISWLIIGLIALYSIPLTLYYINVTNSSVGLGVDASIESSLRSSLENSPDEASKQLNLEALKRYLQIKSLKKVIVNQAVMVSAFALVIIISLAIMLAFLFSSRITRSLAGLTQATRRIAEGDLGYRVSVKAAQGNEIHTLEQSFNRMASRLKRATEELKLAENKATWREVARTIAHEIKNPLTPIKLSTQRVRKKYMEQAGDFEQILDKATQTILCEIENMERLVEAFHTYAKLPDPVYNREDVNTLLEETVGLFSASASGITFSKGGGIPRVLLDAGQFKETLGNIIKNAIEATKEEDRRIDIKSCTEGGKVVIRISDNGPGIPRENIKKLFVPYFTTKPEGNGIGLALAERIISQNGGKLSYQGSEGGGAVFVIQLNPEQRRRNNGQSRGGG